MDSHIFIYCFGLKWSHCFLFCFFSCLGEKHFVISRSQIVVMLSWGKCLVLLRYLIVVLLFWKLKLRFVFFLRPQIVIISKNIKSSNCCRYIGKTSILFFKDLRTKKQHWVLFRSEIVLSLSWGKYVVHSGSQIVVVLPLESNELCLFGGFLGGFFLAVFFLRKTFRFLKISDHCGVICGKYLALSRFPLISSLSWKIIFYLICSIVVILGKQFFSLRSQIVVSLSLNYDDDDDYYYLFATAFNDSLPC